MGAAAFYMATAMPMAYVFYLLPAQMREAGQSVATISLLSLVYLPYAFRVLWAPAIDRYAGGDIGRFRNVMALSLALAVFSVLAFALVEPASQIIGIMAISTLLFVFLATGTTGLDGYAVAAFDENGRRRISIWQTIGFTGGSAVLGLGAMTVEGAAWTTVVLLIAAATAFFALPVLKMPSRISEPPQPTLSLLETDDGSFRSFLRRPATRRLLLLSLLCKTGLGMVAGYLPILQVDYGLSANQAGFFGAFGSNVLGLCAAFVSGWLLIRAGGLRTIGWMCCIAAGCFAFTALAHDHLHGPAFAIGLTLVFLSVGYAYVAPFKALSLAVSEGKRAASHAAALASVDLTLSILAAAVSGSLVTWLGLGNFFWLSMGLCLAAAAVAFRTNAVWSKPLMQTQ